MFILPALVGNDLPVICCAPEIRVATKNITRQKKPSTVIVKKYKSTLTPQNMPVRMEK